MENYEKKYNKLVEAVKQLQKANPSDEGIQNWVNDNVPELRESEDEKTRKALISFLKSPFVHENITDEKVAPWLAWLEKQGEKSIWCEDYTERMGQIINYLTCQAKEEPTRRGTLFGWVALLKSIFRKGLPEIQMPCDEVVRKEIHRIMDVLEWAADKGRISDSDCEDYMILLSAYLPQPKIVWSEEDEENFKGVMDALNFCNHEGINPYDIDPLYLTSWFKSIKQRIGG